MEIKKEPGAAAEGGPKGFTMLLQENSKSGVLSNAKDVLKQRLLDTMMEQVLGELSEEAMVEEALALLDEEHEVLRQFRASLKRRVLDTILDQLLGEITHELEASPDRLVSLSLERLTGSAD